MKDNQPDNVPRLTAKFRKDIAYLRKAFPGYEHTFMLWSPVVKNQRTGSKHNQLQDVQRIIDAIKAELHATVEPVINEKFQEALRDLRMVAHNQTKELDSSIVRYLQVEEHLGRHMKRLGYA